jgi:hypothetical protein
MTSELGNKLLLIQLLKPCVRDIFDGRPRGSKTTRKNRDCSKNKGRGESKRQDA